MHQERTNKHANDDAVPDGAVPAYLLDREGVSRAKVLSNTVKQKRKEKAGKWDVPIPKVCASAFPGSQTLFRTFEYSTHFVHGFRCGSISFSATASTSESPSCVSPLGPASRFRQAPRDCTPCSKMN